jgi:methyl-accepting chemotaxis protein
MGVPPSMPPVEAIGLETNCSSGGANTGREQSSPSACHGPEWLQRIAEQLQRIAEQLQRIAEQLQRIAEQLQRIAEQLQRVRRSEWDPARATV